MLIYERTKKIVLLSAAVAVAILPFSCNTFLDVDVPNSRITNEVVFSDDATASAALVSIYLDIYRDGGFASGGLSGLSTFAGLSADELKNNSQNDPLYIQYERNEIDPNSSNLLALWASMYSAIYRANAVIEGLEASSKVSASTKKQLSGEAFFIRAFCHFYLVNTFGSVALVTSTDYTVNGSLRRVSPSKVYEQIKSDLLLSEELLSDDYFTAFRVRPNRSAATALLSRVYLYTEDWARAEDKATKVIANTGMYSLVRSPNNVFLQVSREAIWQLQPPDNAFYTNEGYTFSINQGPKFNVLTEAAMLAYEVNDGRKDSWMKSTIFSGQTIYLPNKYKKFELVGATNEYSMVIRLAELYLIRAESRLRQSKTLGAISDIDSIRHRAGLPLIQATSPGISEDSLFQCIVQERRIEFMAEWGHRWFDLKRWGSAIDTLKEVKPNIDARDLLYPIPQVELNNNINLNPQNDGY